MIEYYKNLSLENLFYIDENGIVQEEIWKDIPNYEGFYQVSDLGRIKSFSFNKAKILKAGFDRGGYSIFVFCVQQKRKTVKAHQLVTICFLNHKPDKTQKLVVDHINNIQTDNRVKNLQLVTNRHNSSKDRKSKTNIIGVYKNKKDKYCSCIEINKKQIWLGTFVNEIDASNAYQLALKNWEEKGELPIKKINK